MFPLPRPLAFYIGIECMIMVKHAALRAAGFSHISLNGYSLYTYTHGQPASALSDGPAPILFMHGIGLGLLPYLPFVARLVATGRNVIALECDHLGMRWCAGDSISQTGSVPCADDVVSGCGSGAAACVPLCPPCHVIGCDGEAPMGHLLKRLP